MVERFNGRIQSEVLGIMVASHGDLETLLAGFNQAYNARRQRVLRGRSPERVVHERLSAAPELVNPRYKPPNDPSVLPNALKVVARAKDVSHPDTRWHDDSSFRAIFTPATQRSISKLRSNSARTASTPTTIFPVAVPVSMLSIRDTSFAPLPSISSMTCRR